MTPSTGQECPQGQRPRRRLGARLVQMHTKAYGNNGAASDVCPATLGEVYGVRLKTAQAVQWGAWGVRERTGIVGSGMGRGRGFDPRPPLAERVS